MSAVRAVFDSRERVSDAVRRLSENSVPADQIEVFVLDQSGRPARRIPVEDESGTLRGAIIGGIGGALLGVTVVGLTVGGVIGPEGANPFEMRTLMGALRAILTLAAAGVPLGAILALGHWQGRKKIGLDEVERGSLLVVVDTEELAQVARQVFEDSGAVDVRGGTTGRTG
jgi:hypothetical protein